MKKRKQEPTLIRKNLKLHPRKDQVDQVMAKMSDGARAFVEEHGFSALAARGLGYASPEDYARASRRAERFLRNRPGQRVPSHLAIKEVGRLLSVEMDKRLEAL